MAKRRIWARLARATFNGFGIGGLAGWTVYGIMNAIQGLTNNLGIDPAASGAMMFFLFMAGSIGIELSKDLEETASEK